MNDESNIDFIFIFYFTHNFSIISETYFDYLHGLSKLSL